MPEPKKAPSGADKEERERIKRENKRRLEEFVRQLTLSQCQIMSLSAGFEAPPIMLLIKGEGLQAYPREMFIPGDLFGLPFKGRFKDKDGMKSMSAALLLKVKAIHNTLEEALAAEPKLAEQIKKQREKGRSADLFSGMPFDSKLGFATIKDNTGSFRMGPLNKGWSSGDKQASLALTKMFILAFGSLDFDCFVATAVYGDPRAPELTPLRRFRDRVLLKTEAGQRLVRFYYSRGPGWAGWVKDKPWLMGPLRYGLDLMSAALDRPDWDRVDWDRLAKNPWLRAGIGLAGYLAGPRVKDAAPDGNLSRGLTQEEKLSQFWSRRGSLDFRP